MSSVWIKWWKSKFAWTLLWLCVVALVGAFLCAYYLPWPWNLVGAFIACVPSGIIIRRSIINKFTSK